MNKTELISAAAERSGIAKKDAERVINAAIDLIAGTLAAGGRVQLSGFGIFEVKQRQARIGRNLHTQEVIEIPASAQPVFKASKALRDMVGK